MSPKRISRETWESGQLAAISERGAPSLSGMYSGVFDFRSLCLQVEVSVVNDVNVIEP